MLPAIDAGILAPTASCAPPNGLMREAPVPTCDGREGVLNYHA
jgi:hypothetical protein